MIYTSAISGQGPRPDVNNGPGSDLNSAHIPPPPPHHLLKSNSNNCPSPSYSNLVSDGVCICSGLLLMVSWQVPHLVKGCRPDFNNGLGGDSNSVPSLAPAIYLSLTRIMAPPQAISILCQMELHLFRYPTCGFLVGAISSQGLQA